MPFATVEVLDYLRCQELVPNRPAYHLKFRHTQIQVQRRTRLSAQKPPPLRPVKCGHEISHLTDFRAGLTRVNGVPAKEAERSRHSRRSCSSCSTRVLVKPFLESGRPGETTPAGICPVTPPHVHDTHPGLQAFPFSVGSFTWGCAYPDASRKRGASASGIRCDLFGQRDAFFLVLASGVGIPFLSISVAFAIRVSRVSSLLASLIQRQYSLR
jgi:hypothetical protein